MTFLLALAVLSLLMIALSARSAFRDDRGTTPPPASHLPTSGSAWTPSR